MEKDLLSATDFKSEIQKRGWTYRALARRWTVSEGYVSRLSKNTERPMHWDDAVRGLPVLVHVKKIAAKANGAASIKKPSTAKRENSICDEISDKSCSPQNLPGEVSGLDKQAHTQN